MSKINRCRGTAALLALASAAACAPFARAAGPTTAPAPLAQQNADLQHRLDDMQRQLDALRQAAAAAAAAPAMPTVASAPATAAPASPAVPAPTASGATFQSIFLDQKPVTLPGDITAGYKSGPGFYLKQGDEFSISTTGVFDVRYNYTDAQNKTALTNTPLGANRQGSLSGFNLYDGQLTLQGELFKHDQSEAFFKATGQFGSFQIPPGTTGGTFVAEELFGGYAFNNALKVRAGEMIIPYAPFTGLTLNGGLVFPNVAETIVPFLPGFGLGGDVGGSLLDDHASYDVWVGNGSVSQELTNSTALAAGRDNRVATYARVQIVPGGKLGDFLDEADVQGHDKLVWLVGGGFGFESQNDSATAFPGPQGSLRIQGLSNGDGEAGFRGPVTPTGDAFRYMVDVRAKYHGLSFVGAGFYQHLQNEADAPVVSGYPRHSIGQTGFQAQLAYFVVPHHLEVAGRIGQLYTNGLHHQMDEVTFGANYYLLGENLKFQVAETYVPRQAAYTSNTGLLINTQDWLTQAQIQLKF